MRCILTAFAIAVLSLPAVAGDETSAPKWFQAIDANKDRVITLDEMHAARYQRFAMADQDRNGQLTPVELRTDRAWLARFAAFDHDRDGRISILEFERRGHTRFAALDTDGDGRVSLHEAMSVIEAQSAVAAKKAG